jgi:hypothetical protein
VTNLASFTGTIVSDTGTINYSVLGAVGAVREWVVSDATTALCVGCLSFVYQFQVSAVSVGRLAGTAYDAFTVDVSQFGSAVPALTGSVAGAFGANNADRDASGNTIDFDFTTPVPPGGSSFLLIANTNATASQTGTIGIFFDVPQLGLVGPANFTGFAPAQRTAIPEPATAVLLGTGLVALGIRRRRR